MELDDWTLKKLFGSEAEKKVTDPEFAHYLQELSSFGAEKLAGEPERLAEEKSNLLEERENLAFSNYKTFIQAANCSKEIYDDFTLVDQHLNGVMSRLPDLGSECRSFMQEAQKISGRRAANSLTLHKHPQILEVLEIPQVMDTCVRANYWEEALELAQYVSKLQRRLGHIPVIQSIAVEIESQRQLLLEQLLDQLHTQLSLPQCLKVVGYLRRLGAFTETELRIKFLLSRNSWLDSLLAGIPKDDPYQHITKVMELSRVHLFDVVTQYRAVFSDDAPGPMHPSAPAGQAAREEIPTNLPALFYSWISTRVQDFIFTLESDLERGVGGRLDSVLAQCMYFGLSFGRVGADFRSLVCPAFERAALTSFTNHLEPASARILTEISSDDFLPSVHLGSHSALFAHHVTSGDVPSSESRENVTSSTQPPVALMDWNGLAVYSNSLLAGFNDVRLCLPLTLAEEVARRLRESVGAVGEGMASLVESHRKSWKDPQLERFGKACSLLVVVLIPYLNRCLETLFPAKSVAALLEMGVTEFDKVNEMCRISAESLREKLEEFLPKPSVIPQQMYDKTEETVKESEIEAGNKFEAQVGVGSDVIAGQGERENQQEGVIESKGESRGLATTEVVFDFNSGDESGEN